MATNAIKRTARIAICRNIYLEELRQLKNKQKVYAEQKEMREEVQDFISNCSVFKLQKMYEEMKRLNK